MTYGRHKKKIRTEAAGLRRRRKVSPFFSCVCCVSLGKIIYFETTELVLMCHQESLIGLNPGTFKTHIFSGQEH